MKMSSIRDGDFNKWAREHIEYKEIEAKIGKQTFKFTIPERTINKQYDRKDIAIYNEYKQRK